MVTEAYKKVVLMTHTYKNIFCSKLSGKYAKVTTIFLLMLSVLYFICFYIHRKKEKYYIKESKKKNIQNSLWGEGEDDELF